MSTMNEATDALPGSIRVALTKEEREQEKAQAKCEVETILLLDQSVVRDRLTLFHQEVDAILADLSSRTGPDIATIPDEMERRLTEVLTRHRTALSASRQRALFAQTACPLLDSARRQAAQVQVQRTRAYQADVIERQNAVLASRAVLDENLFDDALQTQHRDVILFNLDTLHASLPPGERQELLDAAARDLYRSILDHRLERRPESAAAMLASPVVRRVLGEEEAAGYASRAAEASAARERNATARSWAEADLSPAEAEGRAAAAGAAGQEILSEYHRLRTDADEKSALAHLLPVRDAWSALAAAKYRLDAPGVRPTNPALASLVRSLLEEWLAAGGRPPEPDYAAFLRFMTLPRREIWAELADESRAYAFVRSLGGPDGFAFAVVIRRLDGASTPEDESLLSDLILARGEFTRLRGQIEPPVNGDGDKDADAIADRDGNADKDGLAQDRPNNAAAGLNLFLARVHRDRRVKLERLGKTELLTAELAEIIQPALRIHDGFHDGFYSGVHDEIHNGGVISKTPLASGR